MRTVLLASLRTHTRRYVSAALAVVIGVAFVIVTAGLSSAARDGLTAGVGAPYAGADVVLTTGGTGINPTDRTPEATLPLLDRELPGVAEAIRAHGVAKGVPTAMLSRGLAGVSGRAVVVNLPGSRGGVKDAIDVLADIVPHAVDQLRGGDHVRGDP